MPQRHDDELDEELDDDPEAPSAADMARFGSSDADDDNDDDEGDYDDAAFDDQPERWENKGGPARTVFIVIGVLLALAAAVVFTI